MYLKHFGLSEFPFTTDSDPRFYYPTTRHREALACLLYAVEQRRGLALVTGEVGAGKTMLCRAALARFGPDVEPIFLAHTSLSPLEFLQAVCMELGAYVPGRPKVELLRELQEALTARQRQKETVVLLVDEAQGLSAEVLEEVRLLTNLETASGKLLQILLVGQPELRSQIAGGELRALDQRFAIKFHLGPLARQEVCDYIDHRLEVAGAADARHIVSEEAKDLVFEASGGVPRLINILCDQAFLDAFGQGQDRVTGESMRRVVDEFEGYYMIDAPAGRADSPDDGPGGRAGPWQPMPPGLLPRAVGDDDWEAPPGPAAHGQPPPGPRYKLDPPWVRIGGGEHGHGAAGAGAAARRGRSYGRAKAAATRYLRLSCPRCGTVIGVCEDEVGRRGRCPGCHAKLVVRAGATRTTPVGGSPMAEAHPGAGSA